MPHSRELRRAQIPRGEGAALYRVPRAPGPPQLERGYDPAPLCARGHVRGVHRARGDKGPFPGKGAVGGGEERGQPRAALHSERSGGVSPILSEPVPRQDVPRAREVRAAQAGGPARRRRPRGPQRGDPRAQAGGVQGAAPRVPGRPLSAAAGLAQRGAGRRGHAGLRGPGRARLQRGRDTGGRPAKRRGRADPPPGRVHRRVLQPGAPRPARARAGPARAACAHCKIPAAAVGGAAEGQERCRPQVQRQRDRPRSGRHGPAHRPRRRYDRRSGRAAQRRLERLCDPAGWAARPPRGDGRG